MHTDSTSKPDQTSVVLPESDPSSIDPVSTNEDIVRLQASFMVNNPAPVFRLDDTGTILQVNPASITIIGHDPSDENFYTLMGQKSNLITERLKGSNVITFETYLKDQCFQFSLKRDDELGIIYAYGNEITERKQFESALEESRERLRAMTNAAQDAVVMIDHNGKTTFWNNSAERIFGFSRTEVIGRDLHELILPDELKETQSKAFASFLRSGTGAAIGHTLEVKAIHKAGHLVPVELSLSALEVESEWHAIGIVRDISERLNREEVHNRTVSQYMAMIDAATAIIFLKDIDLRYVMANKAFCSFVDKPLEDIVGTSALDYFKPHEAQRMHEIERMVMDEDRSFMRQDDNIEGSHRTDRWYSTTTVPVHDSQGLVSGVVGLIQDITELHHSREKLVQADKMAAIGTLAAGVAHEINNPVGFINSNLNTMRKYVKKITKLTLDANALDSEAAESMKEMLEDFDDAIGESMEGAERVKKIVADMKSFSRVDKSQKELFNLNEGLETTLNIVWNELKYNCTIEKNYGDIPELYCIPNQLNQVFMNLLVNAGHAMKDESGRISITTTHDTKNVTISIADTGEGIEQENLKRIIEPFFTTKDVGKGTGLGLSVAYDIVKKHGGRLDVTSELGTGSTFTITLPLEGIERE